MEYEYYIIDKLPNKSNEPININLSKKTFQKWFEYFENNKDCNIISNKIYSKKIQHRYSIIQENIIFKPNFKIQNQQNSNSNMLYQNIVNYIQKFNENYEYICVPNVIYKYEYLCEPNIKIKNKIMLYSHKKINKIITDNYLQYSINEPTDLFEINEIIFKSTIYNINISFMIIKDILTLNQSKDINNEYFWIKITNENNDINILKFIENPIHTYLFN